jgi:hypothetical protein
MSYTWEEVILGIDVKHEMDEKDRQQEDIEAAAKKEGDLQAAWSLGLSILGGMALGPAGMFLGKTLGKWAVDYAHDWEGMEIDPGKFFTKEAKEFNKDLKKKAKDIDQGQLLDSVIDLGTMWVQAGGLQEGFGGVKDLTTFGTGDDAWSVFGKKGTDATFGTPYKVGAEGSIIDGISVAPGTELTPVMPGTPDIPGLFSSEEGGFWNTLRAGGKRIGQISGQERQVQGVASGAKSIDTLYEEYVKGT